MYRCTTSSKYLSSSQPASGSSTAGGLHPEIFVRNSRVNEDDVSSIQVGESVVGDPSVSESNYSSGKTSKQELDMLFDIPESTEVVAATETSESSSTDRYEVADAGSYATSTMRPPPPPQHPRSPSRKVPENTKGSRRQDKSPSASMRKASKMQKAPAVTPSPKRGFFSGRARKEAAATRPKTAATATDASSKGEVTVPISNKQPRTLGISACTYLSLLVANPGIKTASTEHVVRDTLLSQIDWMMAQQESKKKSKRNRSQKQLPVDVDDVSFVHESVDQVVEVATERVEEGNYSEAIDLYMGLLVTQRKRANTEDDMACTLSGLTVLHLLKKDPVNALQCAQAALKLSRESNNTSLRQERVATSLAQVGTAHYCASYTHQAQVAWRESLQIACKVLGYEHSHVALLLNNMGCAHCESGKYVEALATFQESLSLQRSGLGASNENADVALLNIACTLGNMSMVAAKRRQYSASVALVEEALMIQESVLPQTGSHSLEIARDHLDLWTRLTRQTEQTTKKDRLHIIETLGNSESPTVFGDSCGIPMRTKAVFQDNSDLILLGSVVNEWTCTQRVKETTQVNFESMVFHPSKFVPKLPGSQSMGPQRQVSSVPVDLDGGEVIDAELHLEDIYHQAMSHLKYHEIEEAVDLFESTLINHKEKYGEIHHLVGTAHHNIGTVLLFAENYEKALERFQEATNVRTAALGPDHPDVSASLLKKGIVQLAKEDLDGAHVTFSQVLHVRRKVGGYNDVEVATVLNNIGCVHYELGGLLSSLKALEECLEIQRRHFEGASKQVYDNGVVSSQQELAMANTLCNIGFLLYKQNQHDKSIAAFEEALAIQKKFLPTTEEQSEMTMKNLAHVMATSRALASREQSQAIEKLALMYMDMLRCGYQG